MPWSAIIVNQRGLSESLTSSALLVELDKRYRTALIRFFSRRVPDLVQAEDLTQEVFLKLISSRNVQNVAAADAFIFKVALNVLRDQRRRKLVRHADAHVELPEDFGEQSVDVLAAGLVEEIAPDRVLSGREALVNVLTALDELSDTTRNIFILHRLERMKQREIAVLFNLSVSAVEKHVIRAMVHLSKRAPMT